MVRGCVEVRASHTVHPPPSVSAGMGREEKKEKDDGIKVNYTMAQVPYLSGPCAGSTLDNSTPRNAKKH